MRLQFSQRFNEKGWANVVRRTFSWLRMIVKGAYVPPPFTNEQIEEAMRPESLVAVAEQLTPAGVPVVGCFLAVYPSRYPFFRRDRINLRNE